MNKMASKKMTTRTYKKPHKGQKRKYEKDASVPHKSKKIKRARYTKHISTRYLDEYEASGMDVANAPSDNSVIYVKTYSNSDVPTIDLTKSSQSILYATVHPKTIQNTTSLKLIYKSTNFVERPQKNTTSLVTIPAKKKFATATAIKSSSNLIRCDRQKLAVLDIAPEYLDEDTDGSEYAFHDLSKADLNETDRLFLESILPKEERYDPLYSLESKQPIENMCKLYGVTPDDGFD
ncbi:uncharacterized protein LOC143202982 [Rhynchophorus ferrugineus]|uniref:Uncharacterized protein n=1 Tax=Rhynchophorus ferrugineus TaxID=354439 RepID=A0A834M6G3_RHYFE|nr:hypothetical protein GWI33_017163 [Rhynchophorus ferrugineus]